MTVVTNRVEFVNFERILLETLVPDLPQLVAKLLNLREKVGNEFQSAFGEFVSRAQVFRAAEFSQAFRIEFQVFSGG